MLCTSFCGSLFLAVQYLLVCILFLLLGAHLTVPNQAAMDVLVIFYLCQSLILSMWNFNHSSVLGKESDYRNVEQEVASFLLVSHIGICQASVCLVHVSPGFTPQHQSKTRRQNLSGRPAQLFVGILFLNPLNLTQILQTQVQRGWVALLRALLDKAEVEREHSPVPSQSLCS